MMGVGNYRQFRVDGAEKYDVGTPSMNVGLYQKMGHDTHEKNKPLCVPVK